jgi:hypothetical protein
MVPERLPAKAVGGAFLAALPDCRRFVGGVEVAGEAESWSRRITVRMLRSRASRVSLIVAALTAIGAETRIGEPWPAAKLTEKADYIVIGRVVSTGDAKVSDKPPKSFEHLGLVGVDSKFRILAALKGSIRDKELVLFHFRSARKPAEKEPRGLVSIRQTPDVDGPCLIRFDPQGEKDARYLMFLKKRPDGRYECVSGQVDPDMSVSKLDGPTDDR